MNEAPANSQLSLESNRDGNASADSNSKTKPQIIAPESVAATLPPLANEGTGTAPAKAPRKGISGTALAVVDGAKKKFHELTGRKKSGPHPRDCKCGNCKWSKPGSDVPLGTPVADSPAVTETPVLVPASAVAEVEVLPPIPLEEFSGYAEGAVALYRGYYEFRIAEIRPEFLKRAKAEQVDSVLGKLNIPEKNCEPIGEMAATAARDLGLPPAQGAYLKGCAALLNNHLHFVAALREVRAEIAKLPKQ